MEEKYNVKYMNELKEYWNTYNFALINEIFVGVGINLGLSEKEAYKLSLQRPTDMLKAAFFKEVFNKFKKIFKHKIPKFRYKEKLYNSKKPISPKQWDKFNNYLHNYWSEHANKVAEDMGIKSYLLGKQTTTYIEEKKPYKNKSLYQVVEDQFQGSMPDKIADAYQEYDFKNFEKNIMNKELSSIGMYVTQTDNELQEAIRQNVQLGIDNGKSSVEVASDLYWQIQKDPNLNNKYTAQAIRKNWNRIASTEMDFVYESGILAPYEGKAMESMKDIEKAQYFVRTGGSCQWCLSVRGTVVRLVPASVVADPQNEKLSSMGIKDPNTDIAIWIGKNNIGLKQKDWMICCPAHPYNVATFQPIDLKRQYYNPKTGDVEYRQEKKKYLPQMEDYSEKMKKLKEGNKPKKIGGGLVQMNNNIYRAVAAEKYNQELEKWRKNPSNPIPVNINSPSYDRIFRSAN